MSRKAYHAFILSLPEIMLQLRVTVDLSRKKMIPPPNLIWGDQIFQAKGIWGIEIFNPLDRFCLKKLILPWKNDPPCQKLYMSTRYINCIFDIAIHSQLDQKLRLEYIRSLDETTRRKYGMRQVIL